MPVPASSAPLASATLASSESAPKLMSETEQRDLEAQRFLGVGPDHDVRAHGLVIEQRQLVQLADHELQVVPFWQRSRGTPMAAAGPW